MARILVIEDAEDVRQLMVDLLEAMNHSVVEVADGLSGVKAALTEHPDLIMLDLMMPVASGESALQFLRGTPELAQIPVLIVSAHSDIQRIAVRLGADAWLSKPVEMRDLRNKIEQLLAKKKTTNP